MAWTLNLPPLPADRSNFDVHSALDTHQVINITCLTILTPHFHPITVILIVIIVIIVFIVIIVIIWLIGLSGTFIPPFSGNANNTSAPGPLCPLQLYGSGTHKIQRCTAYLLWTISQQNILRHTQNGSGLCPSTWCRPLWFRPDYRFSMVLPGLAPILSISSYRHWIEVIRLCTCVNTRNIGNRWKW